MQIVSGPVTKGEDQESRNEELPDRFNSVINFSNFLLHVLRVYTQEDIALDDKQLISQFEKYLLNTKNPLTGIKEFMFALLKCKYLLINASLNASTCRGQMHGA
ncbi:MAG: hypothetical protein PHG00_14040 [Methylococcales bacterium]|nr:hypothetical protein [Methylococcales bacterium]